MQIVDRTARQVFSPGTKAWLVVTGACIFGLVLLDFTNFDLSTLIFVGGGDRFPLRENILLEKIGHAGMRNVGLLAVLALWILAFWPKVIIFQHNRSERIYMALGTTLCALAISLIKQFSPVSCPWDQAAFGGSAHWIPHIAFWIESDGGPGSCFPGGHVSSAFAFIAAAWPGLSSEYGSIRWRLGFRILITALLLGVLLGVVQTLRGAHPPSHTLWTAWFCWFISGFLYLALKMKGIIKA